jgi:hypothetical protein
VVLTTERETVVLSELTLEIFDGIVKIGGQRVKVKINLFCMFDLVIFLN